MRFVVDAQLPKRVVRWLNTAGCDAVHTLDLSNKNRTSDAEIIALADREQRVVVSKDADFVDSHTLRGRPTKLLLISAGNLTNTELEALMVPLIASIMREFGANSFVELGSNGIIVRG